MFDNLVSFRPAEESRGGSLAKPTELGRVASNSVGRRHVPLPGYEYDTGFWPMIVRNPRVSLSIRSVFFGPRGLERGPAGFGQPRPGPAM